jgi:ABC-type transport system substrate-binding protein
MVTKIIIILLGLTLALAVACGSAPAAPDPTATSPAAPASDAAPTTAPTAPVASDTAQPTSTPQMAPSPAEVEVNPGKVTLLTEQFGTERFDPVFGTIGVDYARQFHGNPIASDVEDGRRVVTPGIATKWEISSDSLTWTFTIRDGVKFHDGTDLTAADVL